MHAGLKDLEVESLALARGERLLLRGLSFSLSAGELLSLEGPNGVGKTSLLRAIAGFLEPESGFIRVRTAGGEVFSTGEERATFVSWLGHQDGAKAQMTAGEVLAFFVRLFRGEADVQKALAGVGLARVADLPVQYLSAGQKRRLALARLKVIPRPLWLLDEPLAALDRAGKALVVEFITAHCRAGGLVIAATHEALGLDGRRLVLGSDPA